MVSHVSSSERILVGMALVNLRTGHWVRLRRSAVRESVRRATHAAIGHPTRSIEP